jgi:ribonucleotide monophosphatase NagD (HAD superfamily)
VGKICIVLGPAQSREYVEAAGGICIAPQPQADAQVVVIADQAGFPLLEWLNDTLSVILRRLDGGQPIELILCNPDLIYPRAPGLYGLTAGALAALIETVLMERYGAAGAPGFTRLGKPHPALFAEAERRAGSHRLLMIGDQLATDILGANRYGIDSMLVGSGLARLDDPHDPDGPRPTYTLRSLLA